MRINSIIAKDPGQNPLMNYHYTYDKMDNIVSKVTEHGDYLYDYDDLYRLTGADNPTFDDESFTYDAVGNRLTSEGVAVDWTYNTNNELGAYDDVSFVYDDNGNMVQKNDNGVITDYIYNIEDRLIEVQIQNPELGTQNYFYYYDPFGRRLWKEVGGTKTYFLYADEGLIGECNSSGTEIKTYGYAPGSTWTTDPLFIKQDSQYYFFHNDHLGIPQKMTAINGAVVWSAKYESFGKAKVGITSTITNNLRFPGQYEDQKTGLYYNYHRYYDPKTGRYLKTDPIGFTSGINLYPYADNNPINKTDPDGKITGLEAIFIGAFTAALVAGINFGIEQIRIHDLKLEIYEALKQAYLLDEEIQKRLKEPCLSSDECSRRELLQMQKNNKKTIENLFKCLKNLDNEIGKSVLFQEFFPPKIF